MEAWGFSYVSNLVWIKDRIGTGYYARSKHETLLVGKKGNPPLPIQPPASVIDALVGQHSEKPSLVRDTIVSMYPTGRKLELFVRGSAVEGWEVWGNEANGIQDA